MDTSYLSQQVTTIIERLHGFFDEIGVPSHERDSRESEVGQIGSRSEQHYKLLTSHAALLSPFRDPSQPAQPSREGEA